jgi:UDP-N-acetylglucosamine--N-acetylmuramyl-(pentapeptide) pyrophosphoryl-undecaprenol N-acetylglucosamine transferase
MGKPSVLIPYPYATNQHQEINARSLVQLGGAEMILQEDLRAERLARCLIQYMDNRPLCQEMGTRAREMAKRDAAKAIVDHLVELAQSKGTLSFHDQQPI